MTPKKERVPKSLFDKVFSSGAKIFSGKFLTLRIAPWDKGQKFSFVAPKGIAPKATLRNKMRRRGYESLRKNKITVTKPLVGVFFFKKGSEKVSITDLSFDIKEIFEKTRI